MSELLYVLAFPTEIIRITLKALKSPADKKRL